MMMRAPFCLLLLCAIVSVCVEASPSLTGTWTGFFGPNALYDVYNIKDNSDNTTFSVECAVENCGWLFGTGQVSGLTVKLVLNSGTSLMGTITTNSSSACGWTSAHASGGPLPPAFPSSSCTVIQWNNNSTWVMFHPISKVHVVFMNHLDVGYNGIPEVGFINNVLNTYFMEYFPRAVDLGNQTSNTKTPFIYTTHPWLVSMYLDCPPNLVLAGGIQLQCPSSADVAAFEAAVKAGWIRWHAGPMNMQPEFMSPDFFMAGISIGSDLAQRFNLPPPNTMSQRDVPGMTRGVIPWLERTGVQAVSVGVNPTSCPPQIPSAIRWQDTVSGTEVLAFWHPGGYPNNPGPTPNNAGGVARPECVTVKGFDEALCYAFRTDNSGPPEDVYEVISNYFVISSQFPGAQVQASTLDAFVNALSPHAQDLLPVYTQEIGDVWIQGIASDPYKNSLYLATSRAWSSCLSIGKDCKPNDPVLANFTRFLMKGPEHTWGLPSVGDGQTSLWSNAQFNNVRNQGAYLNCEAAWLEQRQFSNIAYETLVQANHPLAEMIQAEVAKFQPSVPSPSSSGYARVTNLNQELDCNGMAIAFDGTTGAITTLRDITGNSWSSASSPLASLVYSTWNETGLGSQLPCNVVLGGKPGSNEAHPKTQDWPTRMTSLWQNTNGGQCAYLVQLQMPSDTVELYGGASDLWLSVSLARPQGYLMTADIDLQWFNKTSTRLAESYMFHFHPSVKSGYGWNMTKIGTPVQPNDVMRGGNQNQHAVSSLSYGRLDTKPGPMMQIWSDDVPLVSPVTTTTPATPLVNSVDPLTGNMLGFAYNLYNNIWNTNYIFWYPLLSGEGADHKFRFHIEITGQQ